MITKNQNQNQIPPFDPTALAVEELEWNLEASEDGIKQRWAQVERAQRWVNEYQEQLATALTSYTESVARRDGIRYALTVLRNHKESNAESK